jgi:hypothetical protein
MESEHLVEVLRLKDELRRTHHDYLAKLMDVLETTHAARESETVRISAELNAVKEEKDSQIRSLLREVETLRDFNRSDISAVQSQMQSKVTEVTVMRRELERNSVARGQRSIKFTEVDWELCYSMHRCEPPVKDENAPDNGIPDKRTQSPGYRQMSEDSDESSRKIRPQDSSGSDLVDGYSGIPGKRALSPDHRQISEDSDESSRKIRLQDSSDGDDYDMIRLRCTLSDEHRILASSIATEKLQIRQTAETEEEECAPLMQQAMVGATHTIVTDTIETMVYDREHTQKRFAIYAEELSKSLIPGLVPISKQLFSTPQGDTQVTHKKRTKAIPSDPSYTTRHGHLVEDASSESAPA